MVSCVFAHIFCLSILKVASRSVFITTSLMYMALAILSKLSAVFISMPYPVLGGTMITILGVIVGVNLSNLRVVDLASSRNVSIIGMAVFTGRLIPSWVEQNSDAIDTGKRCYLRNEFDFWKVHGITNTLGLLQSEARKLNLLLIFTFYIISQVSIFT